MTKYAAVYFGPDESDTWEKFIKGLNASGIIQLTKEEIDENIKEFRSIPYGTTNRIVLHDKDEVKTFEQIMKVFFSDKEYKITDDPDDKDFTEWLNKKKS